MEGGGGIERAVGDAWKPGYIGTVKRQASKAPGSTLPSFLSPGNPRPVTGKEKTVSESNVIVRRSTLATPPSL